MKKIILLISLFWVYSTSYSQLDTIVINNSFDTSQTIYTYTPSQSIYGIRINGSVVLNDYYSLARVILVKSDSSELLIYEAYPWLYNQDTISFSNAGDETYYLEALDSTYIKVEIVNANIYISTILFDTTYNNNIPALRVQYISDLRQMKIDSINNNIQLHNLIWLAGNSPVAQKTYHEKKKFYSNNSAPNFIFNTYGEEYYMGGIHTIIGKSFSSPAQSNLVEDFDWRYRHGQDWVTPVKDQLGTMYCVGFAVVGALETIINLYYNQVFNSSIQERNILSERAFFSSQYGIYRSETTVDGHTFSDPPPLPNCTTATNSIGDLLCDIKYLGVLPSDCYPFDEIVDLYGYDSNDDLVPWPTSVDPLPVDWPDNYFFNKDLCANHEDELWLIDSYEQITPNVNPDLDEIKERLILYGPIPYLIPGHARTIVGFGLLHVGDVYNGHTVVSGDEYAGQTYFIIKESRGELYGEDGFYYSTNFNLDCTLPNQSLCPSNYWSIKTPITPSVNSGLSNADIQCTDSDGDGFYWWGIGGGPSVPAATCPIYTPAEADCDDSDPLVGPYDNAYNCTPICLFDNVSTDIDADRIIDHNEYITTNITVKSGHKLTIENQATLFIHPLSQIVVEDGAELFLNNGSIKICSDAVWQGTITAGTGAVVKIENESVFVDKIISEWMPLNMNVGTMGTPSDDGIIQKYCYGNSEANCLLYGALYTWDEAMQYAASVNCDPCGPTTGKGGVQGICPTGFHIPSDKEWSRYEWRMENYITPTGTTPLSTFQETLNYRGTNTAGVGPGDKMKAKSNNTPLWDGTNSSGFNAVPGGCFISTFQSIDSYAYFWSATEYSSSAALYRNLASISPRNLRYYAGKNAGFSVRCLKD